MLIASIQIVNNEYNTVHIKLFVKVPERNFIIQISVEYKFNIVSTETRSR